MEGRFEILPGQLDSVEIPAPVNQTTVVASRIHSASVASFAAVSLTKELLEWVIGD